MGGGGELASLVSVQFDLDFVEEHWPDLCELRRPGSPRPWRQALLDPEHRAAQVLRDREERANRDPDAPGFTSAPEHVDVLDVMVEVWIVLDELVARISPDWRRSRTGHAAGRGQAEFGPPRFAHVQPMIEFTRTWLTMAAEERLDIADAPANRLRWLTAEISRVLGLVRAGQLLSGALCSFCRGVTPKQPAGGTTTLRVEEVAPRKHATALRPAVEGVHAVVCWNPLCNPPDEDCGTRYRGRPAWPWHEWEWLAKRLIIADPPAAPPTPATFWADPAVFTIVHSGRTGVDQAVAIVSPSDGILDSARSSRAAAHPGQRIRFIGGPLAGQNRWFTRADHTVGVTRPLNGRLRLDAADRPTAKLIGRYQLAVVNDQPAYVWAEDRRRVTA
jgi:hypothetical protein